MGEKRFNGAIGKAVGVKTQNCPNSISIFLGGMGGTDVFPLENTHSLKLSQRNFYCDHDDDWKQCFGVI